VTALSRSYLEEVLKITLLVLNPPSWISKAGTIPSRTTPGSERMRYLRVGKKTLLHVFFDYSSTEKLLEDLRRSF